MGGERQTTEMGGLARRAPAALRASRWRRRCRSERRRDVTMLEMKGCGARAGGSAMQFGGASSEAAPQPGQVALSSRKRHKKEKKEKKDKKSKKEKKDKKAKKDRSARRKLKPSRPRDARFSRADQGDAGAPVAQRVDQEISLDDYFEKSREFRVWLRQEKQRTLESYSTDEARDLFQRKFCKAWNRGLLHATYYTGKFSRDELDKVSFCWQTSRGQTAWMRREAD
eukprot:scaffold2893_cov254-Pinguiococcus_pyrenoidosus.AAC.2